MPFELGLGDLGDSPHTERLYEQLRRMQGEGGYPSDDESVRMRELRTIALVMAHAEAALDGAATAIHPHQTIELLRDHELARRVPNDAARTEEERQARLVALGTSRRGASAQDIEAALARLGITAEVHSVPRTTVVAEGAPADGIFQLAIEIPADDDTPGKRRAAVDLLRRSMPVLQYGHRQHMSPSELLVHNVAPEWSDADAALGKCALSGAASVTQARAASRLKPYSARSRLAARDLNAMQQQMLIAACSGANNDLVHRNADSRFLMFCVNCTPASTSLIHTMDARYRLVRVAVLYGTDATDRHPGVVDDNTLNAQTYVERLWYTGDGSAPYEMPFPGGGIARLVASGTTLSLINDSGITRTFFGVLEVSGDVRTAGGGNKLGTLTTFADGATLAAAGVTETWWETLRDTVGIRRGNGGGIIFWNGHLSSTCGGVSRQFVVAHTIKPASGANTFVVDSTVDWRGRLLFVQCAVAGMPVANYVGFPGGPSDTKFSTFPAVSAIVGWTGDGVAVGSASLEGYHLDLENGLRIGARSTDGALVVEHTSSAAGSDDQASAILIVHASDPLLAASAIANPAAAVDGNPIVSETLNGVQDAGMLTQGRALEPAPGATPVAVDGMPLGPAVRGSPRVPIAFQVTRRDGRRNQAPFERRQPVAGRLRRVFACDVADGASVVLDDANDWRDRMLVAWVAYSASDIRPTQASDTDIADGTASQTRLPTYTGSGRPSGAASSGQYMVMVAGTDLVLSARSTDGALEVRNDTGGTRYLVGWVEAGFPLGPRSVAG